MRGVEIAVAPDRALRRSDASRVDENPQRAQGFCCGDGILDLGRVSNVNANEDTPDFIGEKLAGFDVDVGNYNSGSTSRQLTNYRGSDTGRASGDNG